MYTLSVMPNFELAASQRIELLYGLWMQFDNHKILWFRTFPFLCFKLGFIGAFLRSHLRDLLIRITEHNLTWHSGIKYHEHLTACCYWSYCWYSCRSVGYSHTMKKCTGIYHQLRVRRALLQFIHVLLRTKRALPLFKVYGGSALVFNRTSLNCNNALLALNWQYAIGL